MYNTSGAHHHSHDDSGSTAQLGGTIIEGARALSLCPSTSTALSDFLVAAPRLQMNRYIGTSGSRAARTGREGDELGRPRLRAYFIHSAPALRMPLPCHECVPSCSRYRNTTDALCTADRKNVTTRVEHGCLIMQLTIDRLSFVTKSCER